MPQLTRRGIVAYSIASIGTGFFYAFSNAVLPLLIPGNNVLLKNVLGNTRSIEGAIIQPLVGAWSDRVWTRLGRRRPFMLAAIPLSALVMALTPLAPGVVLIALSIFLFSLLFNVAADPYTALQADIAPPAQRPTVNAVATVVQFVGQVGLGAFIAFGPLGGRIPPIIYPIVAAGILLAFLVTIAGVPERRQQAHGEARHGLGDYVAAARGQRQALRYLLALFLYNIGINTIQVNLTSFATHVLHVSDSDAVKLFLVLVLVTGIMTAPAAWLGMRFGLKRVIAGGMALIAVAAAAALVVQSMAQVLPVLVLAGIGNAALTLTWPLLTLLIPPERAGVFAGLKTSAESVSALFSSLIAWGMISQLGWGYRGIFLVLLVAIVASLATLATVRIGERTADVGTAIAAHTL